MKSYLTVSGEACGEYTEKRSRFIATLRRCENEEQAAAFLAEMRSKYWDARHNVFACVLNENSLKRFSDDGEPHGTAGKPVLDVIEGAGLADTAVVVTRYFGGVLLGTGGLVRAYSAAAKAAVEKAEKVLMTPCTVYSTVCTYADHTRIVNLIEKHGGAVQNTDFGAEIKLEYYFKQESAEGYLRDLSETFSARLSAEALCEKMLPMKTEG